MKKKYYKFSALLLLCFLLALLSGCATSAAETAQDASEPAGQSEPSEQEDDVGEYFYGEVISTESDFGGILVRPEDPTLGGELVIHADSLPTLRVGDRVKVTHSGQIALSYPGQVFGAVVSLAN